jgi:hypothetical protein
VDLKDAALLPLLQLHIGGCTPAVAAPSTTAAAASSNVDAGGCTPAAVPSGSSLAAAVADSSADAAAPTDPARDTAADGDAEHGTTKQQQQQQPKWKKANCSFGGMISWRNHPHAAAPAAAAAQQQGLSMSTEQQQQVPWVVTGKHLCGAATDFALRACYNAITLRLAHSSSRSTPHDLQTPGGASDLCTAAKPAVNDTSSSSSSSSSSRNLAAVEQPEQYPLQGVAVASCCHHRCGWAAYVGKKALAQHGLGGIDEFETVAWCTSECFLTEQFFTFFQSCVEQLVQSWLALMLLHKQLG